MCDTSNITVGTIVMVKVGRNEIEVVVTHRERLESQKGRQRPRVHRHQNRTGHRRTGSAGSGSRNGTGDGSSRCGDPIGSGSPNGTGGGIRCAGSGRGSGHAQSRAGIRRIAGEEALTPECGSAGPQAQPDAAQHERDPRASHRRRSLEPEWSKDSGAESLLRLLPRDQGKGDPARPQECRPPGRIRVQQLTEAAGAEVGAGSASRSSSRAAYRGRSSWMYAPKCSGFTS